MKDIIIIIKNSMKISNKINALEDISEEIILCVMQRNKAMEIIKEIKR